MAPVMESVMPLIRKESHFKKLQTVDCEYSPNTFTEYLSARTGMRVVVVDQKGPKVLGYFTLATEIHDDSGAPHTLEHLCFMGSKSYPYKGVLDKIATRAYSHTNAWTATDHTAYTLETAGWAGFSQILPIYLEHVILPTLTDAGCYTEVWHVDGSGNDAGVVYSEMQGYQSDSGEIMDLKSNRLMYPEGVGFRYHTGGLVEQLRVLTADRIRQFHRDMYQPKNLCVIIVGEVDHSNMQAILDEFETSILDHIPKPDAPFKRPWVDSVQPPPLAKTIIETVEFPEEDESSGEIMIKFFGPHCADVVPMAALVTLLTYLAGSSASVLENTLVEKEAVASAVYFSQENRPNTVVQFLLTSVDADKLAEVEKRFFEVIHETAEKVLDMKYMLDCIIRQRRQQKFYSESSISHFTTGIISDFLFDKRDGSSLKNIASLHEYDELEKWTESQWREFFKTWIADAAHISILGKPSAEMAEKLKKDEEARVELRKTELGEAGLKELEQRLQEAKAQNDKEIPREILEKFKVPDTSSIHFISTVTARSGTARDIGVPKNHIQEKIDQDDSKSGLFIQFEHVPSNFIHLTVLLGTEAVPIPLRPLLPIYIDNFFNSPLMRDGKKLEFENVVMELEKDTVAYGVSSASHYSNPEVLQISFQLERERYEAAIQWLRDLLWHSVFDLTRIKATTIKLLADIPEEKRSGNSMIYSTSSMINHAPESIGRACDTLVKALYLKRVKRMLDTDPELILKQLEEIRTAICQISNFRVLVVADVERLQKPVSSWETLTATRDLTKPLAPLDKRLDRLSAAGKNPGNLSFIIPLPTTDSSFALTIAKGPEDPQDPRIFALMVAIAYLDAVEGPMWVAVRGTGLAYGTGFSRSTVSGHVTFSIYSSPDASKAFAASRKVVEDFISGASSFDSLALEGAISSIVFSIASNQASMATAAQDSFVSQVVRGVPSDWNDIVLKKVRYVTTDEIKEAMEKILLPAFKPETASVFVTCAPVMEEGFVKGFQDMGFKPEVKPLTFFQDDYGLKAPEGDEEEDEEEEEEDGEDGEEEEVEGKSEISGEGDMELGTPKADTSEIETAKVVPVEEQKVVLP